MRKQAENNINYQERAKEFHVGDTVVPYGFFDSQAGRVTAVWPGIGMVDVESATGPRRYSVDILTRMSNSPVSDPPLTNSSPGARKIALYWADRDRKYKLNKAELDGRIVLCPRCEESPMKKACYVRASGVSDHLMGCPSCMFLIRFDDILNHWKWEGE